MTETETKTEEITFSNIAQELISAISFNASSVSVTQEEEFEKVYELTKKARVIITTGTGRSGLIAQFFAQRLHHILQTIGKVYFIDDTTTPSVSEDCLVIMITGSGETKTQLTLARKVKELKASLVVITSYSDSSIGELADVRIEVSGRSMEESESIMPLGTKFELTVLVILETLNGYLLKRDNISPQKVGEIHRNLE